jgi:hypothetical protein
MSLVRIKTREGQWHLELRQDGTAVVLEYLENIERKGIGDAVAGVTKAAGIKPCGGCKKRQAALNRATPGWLSRILLRSSQLVDRLKARVWKR